MAKTKKKVPKERADHYETKLKVNASFDDIIAISVGKQPKEKKAKK